MSSFFVAVNAVVPFFIYIAFGYFFRASGAVDISFIRRLNQMVFKAFFPIMMFYNLYSRDTDIHLGKKVVILAIGSVSVVTLLLFLIVPRLVSENPKRGVLIQGVYRSNFVLFAVPLTESIYHSQGVSVASMMIAIVVPIYNTLAVVILEYFRGGDISPWELVKKVVTNPMIMGAIVGLLFTFLHITLPECVEKPISAFSDMTTPLALFILGGTLQFSSLKKNMKYIAPALTVKMIILPAILLAIAVAIGIPTVERFVLFTMYATPVAAASYPMAASMGGDGDLAGELVVVSTSISVITIFFWVFFMGSVGIL